ncbi:dihydrofolate reductase [bacterium]|nr:dihydrofolate reductase [bacterium]
MNRKIILNLAISLDGFIANEKGGFDWIKGDGDNSHDTKQKFDFPKFVEEIDILVMGRRAYEDCPHETMKTFNSKKIYVATTKKLESTYDNVIFINGDICKQILKLKKEKGKGIWIWGGAKLADPFIKENIIDEYIIGIIPIILGKGRPLFLGNNPTIKLHLKESTTQEGIVILKYDKRE